MAPTPRPARRLALFSLAALLLTGTAHAAAPAATPEGGPQGQTGTTKPDSDVSTASTAPDTPPVNENYAIHGQATAVEQAHPGFHSAFRGPNSLDQGRRGNETVDVTLYGGVRPWAGAEVWFNPEVDQGFGLSNTLGAAGFPSAEAYKVGQTNPYVRIPRLFARQTVNLSGESQPVAPDLNVLGGAVSANRVVVTIGKFGITDVFDTNKYAHDPRNDFLNWSVVDAGAFDYAADAFGYTYGGSIEWYQDWWTLRAGAFTTSRTPNSKFLDTSPGRQFQLLAEAEARFTLFQQPGKVKLLGFETRAKLAKFGQLLAFDAAYPGANQSFTESVRHLRNKYGASVNVEQQITPDLGFFLRASFADGRTEAFDFTDIDRSISAGFSLSGTRWGRADDTVGLAGVINNISKARKDYLAQGGLGILVGDGALLHAGPEQILETYYSLAVRKGVNISADYQFIANPAYNRDRGPVHVFGGRFHAQF